MKCLTAARQIDDDWLTVLWRKPDYLETVGLQPYYAQYRTGAPPAVRPEPRAPLPGGPSRSRQPYKVASV